MKKIRICLLSVAFVMTLTACKKEGVTQSNLDGNKNQTVIDLSKEKSLIVYFSQPETLSDTAMNVEAENSTVVVDGEVLGNTQFVAKSIQKNIGGDIFRIEPKISYPTEHDVLVEQAKEEKSKKIRPPIKESINDLNQYDIIFLGYPNWWGDMPMILYTFLEEYDLTGKTIIPFNTHGGSGFSDTINIISELEPHANVIKNGFSISRDNMQSTEKEVDAWINELK